MSGMKSGKLVSKTNGSLAEAVGCGQATPDAVHAHGVAPPYGQCSGEPFSNCIGSQTSPAVDTDSCCQGTRFRITAFRMRSSLRPSVTARRDRATSAVRPPLPGFRERGRPPGPPPVPDRRLRIRNPRQARTAPAGPP